jgi:hypothetical protein
VINSSLAEVNEVLSIVRICIELLLLDLLVVFIKNSLIFVLLLPKKCGLDLELLEVIL